MAFKNGSMAQFMKVIGLRIRPKEKEPSGMPKVIFMLESSWRIRRAGSVFTLT